MLPLLAMIGATFIPIRADAVQQIIGDVDGFGFSPTTGLVRATGTPHATPADTDNDGIIEPGEFLPDLDKNGNVAVNSDEFNNQSAAEAAATNGAEWTDRSWELRAISVDPTFRFNFPVPVPGDPDYGVDHYINFVFGDYDVSPASINIDGTVVNLTLQGGGQDGLVQSAYAIVPWSKMTDGEVVIQVLARREPYLTFDYALLATDQIADRDGDGVPDSIDSMPDVPAGVLFSHPVPGIFPGAPNLSCLIGIFEEATATHHWKLMLRSPNTEVVTLVVVATTVNTAETGAIRATVTDENGVQTVTVVHPNTVPGDSNMGTLSLTLQGGKIYDLSIERVIPSSGPGAHHYAIGTTDRRLELGWANPLRYLEHEHQAWAINAVPNEAIDIDIFTDDPMQDGANPASNAVVSVSRPDGTVILPSTPVALPSTISFPNPTGGTYILTVEDADGHYRLKRHNTGGDLGFYLVPCPPNNRPPVAQVHNVTVFTGPDATDCYVDASIDFGSFDPDGDPITVVQSPAGPYPKGTTLVTLTVTDDKGAFSTAQATVTVIDNTPPKLVLPGNIVVGNDPGQCDAVVNFNVTATDNCGPVIITTSIASGSVFPMGTTTVFCRAVDESGNVTKGSFTVTVEDREAPVAECLPTTNPAGKTIPKAGNNPKSGQNPDGFYQLVGLDNCDDAGDVAIYIMDSASDFVSGPFHNGDKVKITQAPGVTPNQKPMAGVVVAHIQLKGDALVFAVDAAGNRSEPHLCLVPPMPK